MYGTFSLKINGFIACCHQVDLRGNRYKDCMTKTQLADTAIRNKWNRWCPMIRKEMKVVITYDINRDDGGYIRDGYRGHSSAIYDLEIEDQVVVFMLGQMLRRYA